MKNLSMRVKLIVIAIIVGLLPMFTVGGLSYLAASSELEKSVFEYEYGFCNTYG